MVITDAGVENVGIEFLLAEEARFVREGAWQQSPGQIRWRGRVPA